LPDSNGYEPGRADLQWATEKMDERYELLAEAKVRNIASYNLLTPEELD
jgi:DNA segregation ATPase FtsK/SpoIIIE-like protein